MRMLSGSSGAVLRHARAPAGTANLAAAFAPRGHRYALLRRTRDGGTRVILWTGWPGRSLLTVAGTLRGLAWSPDARWIATGAPGTGSWLLLDAAATGPVAVRSVASGRTTTVQGWTP
jgi:hypothetical protein